jgi:hypothetical protein
LRSLYEQRFSRRMTFPEYQRQIEIVTDPAAVEQWKEDARNVTTYSALGSENPSSFGSAAEAERHFRQNHLPDLVHDVKEITIDGVASRQLPDRTLRRLIEDAWSKETRSPSQMMQELAKTFRESSLQIFRHRRGMLFVSPIRVRPLAQEQIALSAQVKAILEMLTANPRTNRKDLADKLLADVVAEEIEARKLALASDLRWLISEGYVIEFNDGSLDLPRTRTPKPAEETASQKTEQSDRPMAEGEGAKEAEPGKREEVLGPSDSVDGPNTDEPSQAQDDFTGQEIGSS